MLPRLLIILFLALACCADHVHEEKGTSERKRSLLKKQMEPAYEGCAEYKGCFGYPSVCVQRKDCEVLVSFFSDENGVSFEMQGLLEKQTYMAVGISTDDKMGNDAVTECFPQGDKVIARKSWNKRKSNTIIKVMPADAYSGAYEDGIATCYWTEDYIMDVNGTKFDFINSTYHILLAKGPLTPFKAKRHHFGRLASQNPVNFTAYGEVSVHRIGNVNTDGNSHVTDEHETTSAVTKTDIIVQTTRETLATGSSETMPPEEFILPAKRKGSLVTKNENLTELVEESTRTPDHTETKENLTAASTLVDEPKLPVNATAVEVGTGGRKITFTDSPDTTVDTEEAIVADVTSIDNIDLSTKSVASGHSPKCGLVFVVFLIFSSVI